MIMEVHVIQVATLNYFHRHHRRLVAVALLNLLHHLSLTHKPLPLHLPIVLLHRFLGHLQIVHQFQVLLAVVILAALLMVKAVQA